MKTESHNRQTWMPVWITACILVLLVRLVIWRAGGDALSLAMLGTRFSQGDVAGSEGYDGQFEYYIARDLRPGAVEKYLDVPAYRYQRILLPLLARGLSLGNPALIPWILAGLGIISHLIGTWLVAKLLTSWGVSSWYALVYGLWVGFLLAVRLDLPEPMVYALVLGAWLANERRRYGLAWVLYALALFAKEVALIFVLAQALSDLLQGKRRKLVGLLLVAGGPYLVFQGWLRWVFGQPGLGSGGAMATPFEWIPLMGLWRIGLSSWVLLFGMLIVFGPSVVAPAIWGIWQAGRRVLRGDRRMITLALLLFSLSVMFLPFSTFREPGGILRYACGLVMVVLLFSARERISPALRYSPLWLVLNIFLFKGPVI